ncbi:hypothetical protein HOG48_01090 [Candidatus Peregrinibacteria bacterium]|jgi:hypothetical protein|nr:hypothetical protein [Candidatus Peregrinibacteria bacterium]
MNARPGTRPEENIDAKKEGFHKLALALWNKGEVNEEGLANLCSMATTLIAENATPEEAETIKLNLEDPAAIAQKIREYTNDKLPKFERQEGDPENKVFKLFVVNLLHLVLSLENISDAEMDHEKERRAARFQKSLEMLRRILSGNYEQEKFNITSANTITDERQTTRTSLEDISGLEEAA